MAGPIPAGRSFGRGVLGHIYVGLVVPGRQGKWFHQWSDIDLRYVHGRMEYRLQDQDFPGTTVTLSAAALAESVVWC